MSQFFYGLRRQPIDNRDYPIANIVNPSSRVVLPAYTKNRAKWNLKPYDQLNLGSCTANSTTKYMSWLLKDELSRLFEYTETKIIEKTPPTEDSGATNRDAALSAVKNGICLESLMPYDVSKFGKVPSIVAITDAKLRKAKSCSIGYTLQDIKNCLALMGKPMIIGMNVYPSFETDAVAKTGIVPMPKPSEQSLGGHSVLAIDYDDRNQTLICLNSWGDKWGDKGYFYLPYNYVNHYTWDYWLLTV